MKKIKKFVAILIMGTIATFAFAGCGESTTSEEKSSVPSSSVSEVRQDESSVEESSTEEKSEVESSVESSVEESSEAKSSVESSIEESSEIELSVDSSVEESSEVESSVTEVEKVSFDQVIRYGRTNADFEFILPVYEESELIKKNSLIAILSINEKTYDIYFIGFPITVDSSLIDLFPDDYEPDFSDRTWDGLDPS